MTGSSRPQARSREATPAKGIEATAHGDTIGVDLGGTKVSAVVLDSVGAVVRSDYRGHDGTADGAVSALLALVVELKHSVESATGIGVAAAGLVDRDGGVLLDSPLLKIRNLSLAAIVSKDAELAVHIENDANAALAGIRADGSSRTVTALLALGTGVGGAISVGDHLLDGSFGFAAELGHVPVEAPGTNPCPCGSSGCLELFASGSAVARAGRRAGIAGKGGARVRAEDVVVAAVAGDPDALGILEDAGHAIGTALVSLVPTLDPEVIFIAGGFGHAASDFLIPAAERRLLEQLPFPSARPMPRILRDPIGPLAAAIGAARLARRATTASK